MASLTRSHDDEKKPPRILDMPEQFHKAVCSGSMLVYDINLTQNIIESDLIADIGGKPYDLLALIGLSAPVSYDLFIQKWCEHYVTAGTTDNFKNGASSEHLLDCFSRGELRVTFEFSGKLFPDDIHEIQQIMFLMQDPATGDIIAEAAVRNITAERRELIEQRRYGKLFLDAISENTGCIQINRNTGDTVRLFAENGQLVSRDMGAWKDYYKDMVLYVDENDIEAVEKAMSPEALGSLEIGEKRVVSYRGRNQREDGEVGFYSSTITLADVDGQPFINIINTDNTSAVREEQQQKELIANALSRAESASNAKSVFLSNVSHDIRTPMNAIIGFTALAATHIDNTERVRDYLNKIMSSGNHLLSLINDILDMSRIESGKLHLSESECSLSELMHEVRNIVQADIATKGLEFYIDTVDVFDEQVICDKLRLNQILLNLIGNAIKFTPSGGTISVRISEKASTKKDAALYEFRVKDNGVGMSREFINRIFLPFEREESTSHISQGTGLGMSITKELVEMMGGKIKVTSEKDKGSEFIVELPFTRVYKPHADVRIQELEGARALVVDDDFEACDSVTQMLEKIGMRAEWTLSGKEALLRTTQAVQRNDQFNVYIIDWMMPEMNGIELARNIRRVVGDNVPIIVLTAYDWADIEKEARAAGVTSFCTKPMFLSDLRQCLVECIYPEMAKAIPEEPKPEFSGERILLVEDNEMNREIAHELLEEVGFVVEDAENGAVAVDMMKNAEENHFSLVLMDIQMPVMDGYEATRLIREIDDKRAKVPILAMTANAFDEDRRRALESGMDGHLTKPIRINELYEAIDKTIHK
jgi:signal transduction histidine kinase/CheY-like chemotaxis protein